MRTDHLKGFTLSIVVLTLPDIRRSVELGLRHLSLLFLLRFLLQKFLSHLHFVGLSQNMTNLLIPASFLNSLQYKLIELFMLFFQRPASILFLLAAFMNFQFQSTQLIQYLIKIHLFFETFLRRHLSLTKCHHFIICF